MVVVVARAAASSRPLDARIVFRRLSRRGGSSNGSTAGSPSASGASGFVSFRGGSPSQPAGADFVFGRGRGLARRLRRRKSSGPSGMIPQAIPQLRPFPMPTSFRPYLPGQALLLPEDLREWVPEGHLAHQVSDLVDSLDLSAFYSPYEGDGRRNAPYAPSMMVKVLIYAYATGTFSSRRIARRLEEDVALRMLAAGNFPQRRTVCEFRRRHLEDFRSLFVEVVRVARSMGLARFGALSAGGTKVRANASKRKAMSCERMQKEEERLESEIGELLAAARRIDHGEDALHGEDVRGDEVPEALRGGERRRAAIREARARLDAEAREAPPRPEAKPDAAPADGEPAADPLLELARLEERGVDACVALARDGSKRPVADPLTCPATRRMAEKLATPEGKARHPRRKWLSEAPNGWIKEAMGFRRFSVRGLAKARGEWDLAFLALNVRRMGRLATA